MMHCTVPWFRTSHLQAHGLHDVPCMILYNSKSLIKIDKKQNRSRSVLPPKPLDSPVNIVSQPLETRLISSVNEMTLICWRCSVVVDWRDTLLPLFTVILYGSRTYGTRANRRGLRIRVPRVTEHNPERR